MKVTGQKGCLFKSVQQILCVFKLIKLQLNFLISQNNPNPFNPTPEISYSLSKTGDVKLIVYDATGQEITTLVDGMQSFGDHKGMFDGSGMGSGVYLCKIKTDRNVMTKKMILAK